MKRKLLILILATIPYLLCAQTANEVPLIPLKEPTHILYLIGDAGSLEGENRITGNVLNILKRELDTAIEESSLVFLVIIYIPKGCQKKRVPAEI